MAGWFDEQLRSRMSADEDSFSEAFVQISEAVTGQAVSAYGVNDAVAEVARAFNVPEALLKKQDYESLDEKLDTIFGPCGIMRRAVNLTEDWYKDAYGIYLATTKDGRYAALIPDIRGYAYTDYASGKKVRVNSQTQHNLNVEAVCFYTPLPARKLNVSDILGFAAKNISRADIIYLLAVTLGVILLSMVAPFLTKILFSHVVRATNTGALVPLFVFMACAGISGSLLTVAKMLAVSRIQLKTDALVNAAIMMRVINLPAEFFSKYSSGELAQRVAGVGSFCTMSANVILSVGLTAVMSLIYLVQIFSFTPALVIPALAVVAALVVFAAIVTVGHSKLLRRMTKLRAEEYGLLYALITGVQKIRLSGSEKRAFAKWAELYSRVAHMQYNPPLLLKLTHVFHQIILLVGSFLIYRAAYAGGVAPAEYMAFNASYGLLSGAFMTLCGAAMSIASILPLVEMISPILEAVPEISQGKILPTVRGRIELNNVSFRYSPKSPLVLDKISFSVKHGEYVAIVGKSGCGKSTLMRLLLGFETPSSGVIYYDNNDVKALNLPALRKNIGCVMQNSRLFTGSISSNILISAPHLTEEDAWEAAEMAGIADDIRRMPMKMNTMISEGAGTISGGQRQRIIIARAIAPRPKILLFDEATSALDNLTQRIVIESLDRLKCTRIVIAHRLSTVRNCGRILVIDGGKIAEEGSYDELMNRQGLFASLVERQRIGGE